jgi:type IV fimbrial biogenesis protein FimT
MPPRLRTHAGRRPRGFTLVEAAVVAALLALLAGIALPAFGHLREKRLLEAFAARLEADIHHTRSLAVARHQVVRLSFVLEARGGCYIVHTGDPDDCSCAADGSAQCRGGDALRAVRVDAAVPVSLLPNARSLAFDPVRGTVTPAATIRLLSPSGLAIHQVVNVTGRVRACAPDRALAGLATC